jgi:hypothetical protein
MALLYRITLNRPLTNTELDGNFEYLNTEVEARYKIEDFTAANISYQLNVPADGQTSAQLIETNAINSWLVRDLYPSTLVPEITNKASLVSRDAAGDFEANVITADLAGNADTATEAEHAASSAALDVGVILDISQGGTSSSTAAGARTSLAVVGTAGGEQMTGTLKLAQSLIGLPSLRFGVGADVENSSSSNGDVWFTSAGIRYKIGGIFETVAKVNSPTFTGVPKAPYATTTAQIATIEHVNDATESLFNNVGQIGSHKLDLKANSASPALTGTPTAPTPVDTDNTTQIATTAFVQTVTTDKADTAESNAKTYSDGELSAAVSTLDDSISLKADIDSPTFTGTPTAPSPVNTDNSTKIATTSYTVSYVTSTIANYYTKAQVDTLQSQWGTSSKFVQSTEPAGAVNGDFWFKI